MKKIAFILYPGLTLLDLVGPLQVMNSMCERTTGFRTIVAAKDDSVVEVDVPLKLIPSGTFQDTPNPAVLIVPGGESSTIKAMGDEGLMKYLRESSKTAYY